MFASVGLQWRRQFPEFEDGADGGWARVCLQKANVLQGVGV